MVVVLSGNEHSRLVVVAYRLPLQKKGGLVSTWERTWSGRSSHHQDLTPGYLQACVTSYEAAQEVVFMCSVFVQTFVYINLVYLI